MKSELTVLKCHWYCPPAGTAPPKTVPNKATNAFSQKILDETHSWALTLLSCLNLSSPQYPLAFLQEPK